MHYTRAEMWNLSREDIPPFIFFRGNHQQSLDHTKGRKPHMAFIESPVLQRVLHKRDGSSVEILVGAPVLEGQDWFTHWSITGLEEGDVRFSSGGIDSMQSMIFALSAIGDRIAAEQKELLFMGSESLQLLRTTPPKEPDLWMASVQAPTA